MANHIPVVRFSKGQRKVDVMRPLMRAAAAQGRSQVVAAGIAQEYALVAEGLNLDGLGETRRLQGRPQEAVELLPQSVVLLGEVRARDAEADALWHLGLALAALGNDREATSCQRQALEILDQLGAPESDELRRSSRGAP